MSQLSALSSRCCQAPTQPPHRRRFTAVVLMPPGSSTIGRRDRTGGPLPADAHPCRHHFGHRPDLSARERATLVRAEDGRCAGGPIGLLDLPGGDRRTTALAHLLHRRWEGTVAGTEPALPWQAYLRRHHADPGRYPCSQAWAEFTAQPRVEAMLAHDRATAEPVMRFAADEYGGGLSAHQSGACAYAEHLRGLVLCGDALVDTDGTVLLADEDDSGERGPFHTAVRDRIANADPLTVVVAAHIYL